MSKDYDSYSKEELIELNKVNLGNLFEWYVTSPSGAKYQDSKIRRFETNVPDPVWNGILASNHTEQEIDQAIKQQLEYFKSKGKLGIMWYTYPSTRPSNINEILESHGFVNINPQAPLMSIDLHRLPEPKTVEGLEIKPEFSVKFPP